MFRRQLIFVMLLTACGLAIADQVTLTTGETLQGKLTEQTDTVVTLEHPILGTLSIPAEHVSAVVEDQPPMKAAEMVEVMEGVINLQFIQDVMSVLVEEINDSEILHRVAFKLKALVQTEKE